MKHRNIQSIFSAILFSLFVILMAPGNNVMAYYGVSGSGNYYGVTSPNGVLGGLGGLYGGSLYGGGLYGMYGGLYGGSSLYGGGGLYGMYGGLYGGSSLYGGGMYGGLYGGSSLYGGGLYGMYGGYGGSSLYGGLYGMYGGYGGTLSLGLTNLMNPLPYYTSGGMYNLLGTFDPLGDPLLGFGMLSMI